MSQSQIFDITALAITVLVTLAALWLIWWGNRKMKEQQKAERIKLVQRFVDLHLAGLSYDDITQLRAEAVAKQVQNARELLEEQEAER